jgi:hypothetical protein
MDELKEALDQLCSYPGTRPWVEAFGFPESECEWIWFRNLYFYGTTRVAWAGPVPWLRQPPQWRVCLIQHLDRRLAARPVGPDRVRLWSACAWCTYEQVF